MKKILMTRLSVCSVCETSHVGIGHLGTLVYHSFRFRGIRLFNAMPKQIRDLSSFLEYSATVWHPRQKYNSEKLEMV